MMREPRAFKREAGTWLAKIKCHTAVRPARIYVHTLLCAKAAHLSRRADDSRKPLGGEQVYAVMYVVRALTFARASRCDKLPNL
jgi:hypothetical protein